MISKEHRFHGHASLGYVYKKGKTVRVDMLAVRTVQNARRSSYRVAVVVAKKVNKSAVVRNRIRRRVYEIIRTLDPALDGAYDIVFSIYDDRIAYLEHAKLEDNIKKALSRSGVV